MNYIGIFPYKTTLSKYFRESSRIADYHSLTAFGLIFLWKSFLQDSPSGYLSCSVEKWDEKVSNLHPLDFQSSATDRISYRPLNGVAPVTTLFFVLLRAL